MSPFDALCATRHLDFRDPRPPQEIQFDLERELMVLLPGAMEDGRLVFRGTLKVNGAVCQAVLRFEAALPRTNGYALTLTLAWDGLPPEHHDYHRKASAGWFDLWTRHFTAERPPGPDEGSPPRYQSLATQALAAEAHLASVEAVQQEILALLRAGGSFSTAHKEGGTVISCQNGRFVRADYGESNHREEFPDEAALLTALRNLYQWETSRGTAPGQPSDLDRWKLILRLLRPAGSGGRKSAAGRRNRSTWQVVLAFLVAFMLVGGAALLRGGPFGFHRFSHWNAAPHAPPAKLPSFDFPPVR